MVSKRQIEPGKLKGAGWREAEALANEGCAATLDTAHEALSDALEMLQYHGRSDASKELLTARGRLRDERNTFLQRANEAPGRPVNVGDRVVTTDGPGVVQHVRKDDDLPTMSGVIRGRLWVWVRLDAKSGTGLELYDGAKVRPER